MRLDKFLKVSRLIIRRATAKEICENGRVFVNNKVAKPSLELKVEDIIELNLGKRIIKVKVKALLPYVKKEESNLMYEII